VLRPALRVPVHHDLLSTTVLARKWCIEFHVDD
jgi:hypothetical protein